MIRLKPTEVIFYIIFFLVFCFSGILTMLDIFPFRMAFASLLVIPIILLYGFKIDIAIIFHLVLLVLILISGLLNHSKIFDIAIFGRMVIYSILIYYIMNRYINSNNIEKIKKLCLIISMVQLPIVLFQLSTYELLPSSIRANLISLDYDFGTFNFKDDPSMTFFLLLVITYLLFNKENQIKRSLTYIFVIWLSFTILIANSELSKIILVLILLTYFFVHFRFRNIILSLITILILLLVLNFTELPGQTIEKQQFVWNRIANGLKGDQEAINRYLEGNYSRGGAIYYFLSNKISWFGDGPNKYTDPINKTSTRGNFGHIFTFYSEVGLIALITSLGTLFIISFHNQKGKLIFSSSSVISFISIILISFTHPIMNDISVLMSYYLFIFICKKQKQSLSSNNILSI